MTQPPETLKPDEEAASQSELLNTEPALQNPMPLPDAWYWAKHFAYRFFRLSGESVAVIFGLGIAWLYLLTSVSTQQSVDLKLTKPWAEQGFAKIFEGHDAKIGDMRLRWLPSTNHIAFEASDIQIFDKDEALAQAFPKIETEFDYADIALGRHSPTHLRLDGGALTVLIEENGQMVAGLGTPQTVGSFGPVFRRGGAPGGRGKLPEQFESLDLRGGRVFIEDRQNEMSLAADVSQLKLRQIGDIIALHLDGQIAQTNEPAKVTVSAEYNQNTQALEVIADAQAVRLDTLAPRKGRFKGLARIAAPFDVSTDTKLTLGKAIQSASTKVKLGVGEITGQKTKLSFQGFDFEGLLKPGEEKLTIKNIALASERVTFAGGGTVTEIGALTDGNPSSSPVFDLKLKAVDVDATPVFETPFKFTGIEARGQIDLNALTADLGQLDFITEAYRINTRGNAKLTEGFEVADMKISGAMVGRFLPSDLVAIWPVKFVDGGRNWIDRSIKSGVIDLLKFDINLDPEFFKDPQLTPERVNIDMGVSEGVLRYISTMTPVTNGKARGQISGNSLAMTIESGNVGGLTVTGGTVEIPRLMPKGGDLIINVEGRGEASEMMGLLNQKPFEFADKYGVDPSQIGGTGQIKATITRPLLVHFDQNRISYEVEGDFVDAAAPIKIGAYPIHKGRVHLQADKYAVNISGPAQIGPWPVDITWDEYLGADTRPTSYKIAGWMDREILDDFGIGLREFFDGRVKVNVEAYGGDQSSGTGNLTIDSGMLRADLTDAELTVGEIWSKPKGQGGVITTMVDSLGDQGFRLSGLTAQAPGLELAGQIEAASNLRLIDMDMKTVKIEGLVDAAVQLKPDTEQQRLSLFVNGAYADVSPWMSTALNSRSSGLDIPLLMTASLEKLVLKPDYALSNSRALLTHTGQSISDFRLAGDTEDGPLKAELVTDTASGARNMTLSVPEASKAVQSFLGIGSTRGGTLELRTKLPPLDEDGPIIGQAMMTEFKLMQTPFLAQILSLASLTGMSDMLGGEGLRFTQFDVPFILTEDNHIRVRDARLFGPVLGMTGDGDIALEGKALDFDGTLVPAYTANSILGDIPLLGDIFAGKDGGVFALNYTVRGPFDKTQISVNPLSALTPGIMRGIFKPSREKLSDEILAEIEAVKPKPVDEAEPN